MKRVKVNLVPLFKLAVYVFLGWALFTGRIQVAQTALSNGPTDLTNGWRVVWVSL